MNGVVAPLVSFEAAPIPADLVEGQRRISVVMVVYMTGEALEQSLACVLADPLVDELVVVDNGSTRAEEAKLRDLAVRDARVILLSGHGNVGFARGANLGARQARGDILLFLNPDAFLQPGCVEGLARAIEDRPAPCLVGGRVLNADRTEQRGARRGEITPVTALVSLSRLARRVPAWSRFEVHWEEDATPETVTAVPTISGACFAMRREDFEAVDGFDEGYFLHVEDVDLCWRVRQAGGEVLFQPHAEVIHLGHTSHASPLKVEFHKGVGLARYFRKRAHRPVERLLAWLLSPVILCTAVARPVIWRVRGRAA
jgi:N-acetylglucosaminyl-diphospho-decaprenol L-rhamnosyltransferase